MMLTGQNGILTRANQAKENMGTAQTEELIKLSVTDAITQGQGNMTDESLRKALDNKIGAGKDEITEDESDGWIVIKDEKSYKIGKTGNVNEYDPRAEIKIGDYVDYKPDTESGKTYDLKDAIKSGFYGQTVEKEDDLNWRVLRKNDDGSMDLIGDATNGKIYLVGSIGYNNGVYLLNDICKELYSNSAHNIIARSVNLEDMDKWLPDGGKKMREDYTGVVKYGETKQYKGKYSYRPYIYGEIEDENPNYFSNSIKSMIPENGTASDDNILVVKQTYFGSKSSSNYGDGGKVLNSPNYYWVATRCVRCYDNFASFMMYMVEPPKYSTSGDSYLDSALLYSSNNYAPAVNNFSLRPVVSLGADAQITPSTEPNDENHKHTIDWKK